MSRLLKDCMSSCSCGKDDKDICDVIDDLGKLIEGINNNKKTECKEKKEEGKDLAKELKELKEETGKSISALLKLIKKVDKEKWVIGEYKWMPIGTKMPEGWVKITLGIGQTLVEGIKEGTTLGKIQVHQHYHDPLWDNKGAWVLRNAEYAMAGGTSERQVNTVADQDDAGVAFQTADHGTNLDANQKENLAAGKFAQLWQFKGVDFVRNEMKKCIENSLEESIGNCMKNIGIHQ